MKIAYILKWFPKLSETFILNEIIELKTSGHEVVIIAEQPYDKKIVSEEIDEYNIMDNVRYPKDTLTYVRELPITNQTQALIKMVKGIINGKKENQLKSNNKKPNKPQNTSTIKTQMTQKYKESIIANQLKSDGVEIIHAHFATWAPKALRLSELSGIQFTFTAHAHDIFAKGALSNSVLTAMKKAAGIIVISDFNKQFLMEKLPEIEKGKIKIVHCGIKMNKFKPSESKSKENKIPKILSVARLEEKKGFKYLIEALNILNKKNLDFKAIIVGEGTQKQMLHRLVNEYGLTDKLEFTGALDDSNLLKLFKSSDIFALPCVVAADGDRDGIPVSLMEAMALEMSVVSTTVSGIPELIEHKKNGLLVPEKDAEAFAAALEELIINRKLMEKFGTKGRVKVEKEFNIKHTVQELLGHWEKIKSTNKLNSGRVN